MTAVIYILCTKTQRKDGQDVKDFYSNSYGHCTSRKGGKLVKSRFSSGIGNRKKYGLP